MAQWFAALAEDQGSVPSTDMEAYSSTLGSPVPCSVLYRLLQTSRAHELSIYLTHLGCSWVLGLELRPSCFLRILSKWTLFLAPDLVSNANEWWFKKSLLLLSQTVLYIVKPKGTLQELCALCFLKGPTQDLFHISVFHHLKEWLTRWATLGNGLGRFQFRHKGFSCFPASKKWESQSSLLTVRLLSMNQRGGRGKGFVSCYWLKGNLNESSLSHTVT